MMEDVRVSRKLRHHLLTTENTFETRECQLQYSIVMRSHYYVTYSNLINLTSSVKYVVMLTF